MISFSAASETGLSKTLDEKKVTREKKKKKQRWEKKTTVNEARRRRSEALGYKCHFPACAGSGTCRVFVHEHREPRAPEMLHVGG